MKRALLVTAALLIATTPILAQAPAGPTTIVLAIQRGYNTVKNFLTQEAEKLTDADYAFKPSSMSEVRGFGQLFGHVANAQFNFCAAAKGVPNPNQGKDLEQLKTKAEVTKALGDSFAFCDDAYAALTDANATELVTQGRGQIQRAALLMNNVVHNNEMYGTGAVYLRAKGIVPPSTEQQQMGRGAGGGRGRGGQQ
jgi:DinB superfamily